MSKRDEYIAKMKQQLDELNTQLGELESKAKAGQKELGKKYDEQVTHLRELSLASRKKLDEVMEAGEDKWEALVAEGEKVHKAFVHSVHYFKSQL
jgi:ATP/maltotriose-dependent transcriptional regulator MalT